MSHPAQDYSGPGQISAVLRPADLQAPDVEMGAGSRLHFLATGAETGGQAGLYYCEFLGPPSGAPPHYHDSLLEWFYVLACRMQFYNGEGWVNAGPGDFLLAPQRGIHGFRNQSGMEASMLLGFVPGAPRKDFFEGFAALEAGTWRPGPEEFQDFMLRHDNHMVRS